MYPHRSLPDVVTRSYSEWVVPRSPLAPPDPPESVDEQALSNETQRPAQRAVPNVKNLFTSSLSKWLTNWLALLQTETFVVARFSAAKVSTGHRAQL